MFTEDQKLRAKGFVVHDGGLPPISDASQPAVVFDDGAHIRAGTTRTRDIDWSRVRGWKLLRSIPGKWSAL